MTFSLNNLIIFSPKIPIKEGDVVILSLFLSKYIIKKPLWHLSHYPKVLSQILQVTSTGSTEVPGTPPRLYNKGCQKRLFEPK